MLKSVLKQRVNIQFCILNESSATLSLAISSCLPVIQPYSATGANGTSNFPHFDFEPALADSGDQDRNRESILAVTFSRCEFC
jgi:hypothetical protein